MERYTALLVFTLDDQRYGLFLDAVERVIRAVEVTPLPQATEIVLGVVNVQGRVVPVVNIRRRFRLTEREMGLNDQIIIANTSKRTIALIADTVTGVLEGRRGNAVTADGILPGLEYVEGVVKLEDGIVLIHNLDKFLSLEEEEAINDRLSEINNQWPANMGQAPEGGK